MSQNQQLGAFGTTVTVNTAANTVLFASQIVVGNSTVNNTINATSVSGAPGTNVNAQYTWSNTQTFSNTITFSSTINGTANNTTYVNGKTENNLNVNAASSSLTNTFTIGTAAYYVANGNFGIGTSAPSGSKIHVSGNNTVGGATYLDFLKATNVGATNPSKTFRLNSTGAIEIVNDAYTALCASLDNSGNLTTTGTITDSVGTIRPIVTMSAQNTTSGTAVDFTGIPSWVKRITIMFRAVSTNGVSPIMVQIGSGSFTTTGYLCNATGTNTGALTSITTTTGFAIEDATLTGFDTWGSYTLVTFSNYWFFSGSCYRGQPAYPAYAGGGISLGGTLDRVRITTQNGTDSFDAGSINLLYE